MVCLAARAGTVHISAWAVSLPRRGSEACAYGLCAGVRAALCAAVAGFEVSVALW